MYQETVCASSTGTGLPHPLRYPNTTAASPLGSILENAFVTLFSLGSFTVCLRWPEHMQINLGADK
jgi:hypothetical protein